MMPNAGAAMVGRNQLLPALDRLQQGDMLQLTHYTDKDSEHRYFKNRLGGLGRHSECWSITRMS
jgi:hypothetical protein